MKKSLLFAIVLGLLTGGIIVIQLKPSTADQEGEFQNSSKFRTSRRVTSGPLDHSSREPRNLHQERRAARKDRPFSPYRDRLFSRDLLDSLSHDELIEAIKSGQIPDQEISIAFAKVARIDPRQAFALLDELAGPNHYRSASIAVLREWSASNPTDLFTYLNSLPASSRKSTWLELLAEEWGRQDPKTALAQFKTSGLQARILEKWAARDFEAARKWVSDLPKSQEKEGLEFRLMKGKLGELQEAEAVDFILKHEENPALKGELLKTFQTWTRHGNATAAIDRFIKLPPEHPFWQHSGDLGSSTVTGLIMAKKSPDLILESMEKFPGEKSAHKFLRGAVLASVSKPEISDYLFQHLPESRERTQTITSLTEHKMREDPKALATWLDSLPVSESRDAALARFSTLLNDIDPARARDRATEISDPKVRQQQLGKLTGNTNQID